MFILKAIFIGLTLTGYLSIAGIVDAAIINAANAGRTAVLAAINTAATGDTVMVPSGTATWAAAITLPSTKDLTIVGNGIGSTIITCSSDLCLEIPNSRTHIVSGFTFNGPAIVLVRVDAAVPGKYQRLHHNKFVHTGAEYGSIDITGEPTTDCNGTTQIHPSVLIDNNEFHDMRIFAGGTACSFGDGTAQHRLWSQNPPVGSWPGIVYIESNDFYQDGGLINYVDANYGGRYVLRYNKIHTTSGNSPYAEVHGIQGGNRASQWKEIYGNVVEPGGVDNFFGLAFIRSGSGVVFNNRVPSTAQTMKLNNERSYSNPGDGGECNGSSNWDGNTAGRHGYPCRDQIGRMKDNAFWTPGSPYAQNLMPFYFWQNYLGSGTTLYVPTLHPEENVLMAQDIVQNREWYTQNISYNGTSGVGVGTLASRPATCTAGVAYWATDQGSWNKSGSGGQGVLYKCTSTNTWSLYYTPYTYPHPLVSGGSIPAKIPTPPMILQVN